MEVWKTYVSALAFSAKSPGFARKKNGVQNIYALAGMKLNK